LLDESLCSSPFVTSSRQLAAISPGLIITPLLQGRPGFGCSPKKLPLFIESPSSRECEPSRLLVVASPATSIPVDGVLSSATTCSCYLLPRYRHTCCEDLLRGATGCCRPVAGELVLCSHYCAVDRLHRTFVAGGQGLPFVGALAFRRKIHLLFSSISSSWRERWA
jgi:hypothetical protein